MKTVRALTTRFDDIMSAVTYAEAGEFETARYFMRAGEGPHERPSKRAEKELRKNIVARSARK